MDFTPYNNIPKPADGEAFGDEYRGFADNLDPKVRKEGPIADRPLSAPTGGIYDATDQQVRYRYDGTDWNVVGGIGSATKPLPSVTADSITTDKVATTNATVDNAPSDAKDVTRKFDLDDRVTNAATRTIETDGNENWHRICRVSDGSNKERGDIRAKAIGLTPDNTGVARSVSIHLSVGQSIYDVVSEVKGDPNDIRGDFEVIRSSGTGTNGEDEWYLYLHTYSFCRTIINVAWGTIFGGMVLTTDLTNGDLEGPIEYSTGDGSTGITRLGEVRAIEAIGNEEQSNLGSLSGQYIGEIRNHDGSDANSSPAGNYEWDGSNWQELKGGATI